MAYFQSVDDPELQAQENKVVFVYHLLWLLARDLSVSDCSLAINGFSVQNCFTGNQKLESSFGGE